MLNDVIKGACDCHMVTSPDITPQGSQHIPHSDRSSTSHTPPTAHKAVTAGLQCQQVEDIRLLSSMPATQHYHALRKPTFSLYACMKMTRVS